MNNYVASLGKIHLRCRSFIECGVPLYKDLPHEAPATTFKRIKVRLRRAPEYSDALNEAVGSNIATRYIEADTAGAHPFYMFPVDGYRITWTPAFESLREAVSGHSDVAVRHGNVHLAALAGRKVLVHNIADYYIVRRDIVQSYDQLLEAITSSTFAPMHIASS